MHLLIFLFQDSMLLCRNIQKVERKFHPCFFVAAFDSREKRSHSHIFLFRRMVWDLFKASSWNWFSKCVSSGPALDDRSHGPWPGGEHWECECPPTGGVITCPSPPIVLSGTQDFIFLCCFFFMLNPCEILQGWLEKMQIYQVATCPRRSFLGNSGENQTSSFSIRSVNCGGCTVLQEVKTGSPFLLLSNLLLEPSQKPELSEPPEPRKHSHQVSPAGIQSRRGKGEAQMGSEGKQARTRGVILAWWGIRASRLSMGVFGQEKQNWQDPFRVVESEHCSGS